MNIEDETILARTIYGEARSEDDEGRRAIAHVVLNRVSRCLSIGHGPDHTIAAACLRPFQFSCWNWNDPNRDKLMAVENGDPVFRACRSAVRAAELEIDFTHGARHYLTTARRAQGWPLSWGIFAQEREPCYVHGGHLFYNDLN